MLPEQSSFRERFQHLTAIGIALSSERSIERLLVRILTEARHFARAEAGSLYVRKDAELLFTVVQNDRLSESTMPVTGGGRIPIMRSSIAGHVASTGEILNLPDVYNLPPHADFSFCRDFDDRTGYRTQSMLVVPMRAPGGAINGVIQLINAIDKDGYVTLFDTGIEDLCRSLASQAGVALRNAQLSQDLEEACMETVWRLARAAEFRDTDTGSHVKRVAHYAEALALAAGLPEDEAQRIRLASPMHDVGKVGVADAILKKAGPLNAEERKEIERHTLYGAAILAGSQVPLLQLSREIALTHHERWDGKGYPNGLRREEIPLSGRITAVADVFDALTSWRCYKNAMPAEEACAILRRGAGTHFDPVLVETFLEILPQILAIRDRFADQPTTM